MLQWSERARRGASTVRQTRTLGPVGSGEESRDGGLAVTCTRQALWQSAIRSHAFSCRALTCSFTEYLFPDLKFSVLGAGIRQARQSVICL